MTDLKTLIKEFNEEVISAHNKHYECSMTGLIIPSVSPNGNPIYHLYSNGEITYQKGGWAYLQRSEFCFHQKVYNCDKLWLKFVKSTDYFDGLTYVILTEKECNEFRKRMIEFVEMMNK